MQVSYEYIKSSQDGLTTKRVIAPLPAMPLEKSIAGASLLTHLLVSKWVDHQPVYRPEPKSQQRTES